MQEKRTAYFDICPMTGSVRRRITINSSFPDMGVPAYRARAFLSDMKHFPEFESVYRSYFSAPYPARMTVASAGIYDGLDVEMDAIAYLP